MIKWVFGIIWLVIMLGSLIACIIFEVLGYHIIADKLGLLSLIMHMLSWIPLQILGVFE